MWVRGPIPTGRTYQLGYCTHPSIGRVVRDDDACLFFVRGSGFDENAALRAFERMKEGKDRLRIAGPKVLDLDFLRKREAVETQWDPRRRNKR